VERESDTDAEREAATADAGYGTITPQLCETLPSGKDGRESSVLR
jgi:hypothetical protein